MKIFISCTFHRTSKLLIMDVQTEKGVHKVYVDKNAFNHKENELTCVLPCFRHVFQLGMKFNLWVCCVSIPLIWSLDLSNITDVLMDHLNRAGCLLHHKYEKKSMYADCMLMLQVFLTVDCVTLQSCQVMSRLFISWVENGGKIFYFYINSKYNVHTLIFHKIACVMGVQLWFHHTLSCNASHETEKA